MHVHLIAFAHISTRDLFASIRDWFLACIQHVIYDNRHDGFVMMSIWWRQYVRYNSFRTWVLSEVNAWINLYMSCTCWAMLSLPPRRPPRKSSKICVCVCVCQQIGTAVPWNTTTVFFVLFCFFHKRRYFGVHDIFLSCIFVANLQSSTRPKLFDL